MIQLTKQLGHLDHQNHPFLVDTLKCSKVLVRGPPAAMGWLNMHKLKYKSQNWKSRSRFLDGISIYNVPKQDTN